MREIRDKLSLEIIDMNDEQEREYLDEILSQTKVKSQNNALPLTTNFHKNDYRWFINSSAF